MKFLYSDAKAHEIKIDVKKGIEAKNYDEQVKFNLWPGLSPDICLKKYTLEYDFIFRLKRKNWSH